MFFQKTKQLNTLKELYGKEVALNHELTSTVNELVNNLNEVSSMWPLQLDTTVYEVVLRNAKGRFTSNNASKEQSQIVDTVVDKKNYFKLVDKYNKGVVFKSCDDAVDYLNSKCSD